jgi:hypothetical protein
VSDNHVEICYQHFHCRQTGRLCLTLATQRIGTDRIRVAAAIASRKDQPNRKAGRMIAAGRLLGVRNKFIEMSITEYRQMIRDRTIISLFPHADNYALSTQKILRFMKGDE